MSDLQCKENCGHSEAEHNAFDEGYEAGLKGNEENPYSGELREIWEIGFSVGKIENEGEK